LGLVLDSSAAVAAERAGTNPRRMLENIALRTGDEEIAVSVVTLLELAHGVYRALEPQRKERRRRFLDELMAVIPIQPVTSSVALRAGQIDGESQANGVHIPLSDLLIGVTALELGYEVGTGNVRHFQLIPGLRVISL